MIVVMNRITVAEGREKDFEQTFSVRDRAVDRMPGFLDMEVLCPPEGSTYIVMSRWKSREDFDRWTQSEVFLAAHKKQSPGVTATQPTLEIYEVLSS
jgi:heme-degrading monooxygenase HmoA